MPPIGELLVDAHDALRQTIDLAGDFAFSDNPLAGAKADGRRKPLQFSQLAGIEGYVAEEIREVSPSHCSSISWYFNFLHRRCKSSKK
jgi:hypothetical protein